MNSGSPDILLVEDNPLDVELVRYAREFNTATSTLHVARDGVEAVEYLLGDGSTHDDTRGLPKLVLLDLHLPRLTGFEVLARLRSNARTQRLPVVILSSSDEESDVDKALRLGANAYLRKPSCFVDLCELLTQIERDWLGP
jgi:two-component system response regulator